MDGQVGELIRGWLSFRTGPVFAALELGIQASADHMIILVTELWCELRLLTDT